MEMTLPIIKSVWLNKISKELKSRPLEELEWAVASGVRVSPFVHSDDFLNVQSSPLFQNQESKNDWQIVEKILVDDVEKANRKALAALSGGIDRLDFQFEKLPDSETEFQQLFDGVFLEMVAVTFSGEAVKTSPSVFIFWFENVAKAKHLDSKKLRGALNWETAGFKDWRFLIDLIAFSSEKMPHFRLLTIQTDETDSANSLSDLLQKTDIVLRELSKKGMAPKSVLPFLQIQISIGTHFLTEIARLRAFQIVWMNWQKGWKIEISKAPVSIFFLKNAYSENANQNMIRATEMTLAAAIGGAEQVAVLPFSDNENDVEQTIFHLRIARNVQHILKMESFIDRTEDPIAGAYFIENLTSKLAQTAWQHFQEME